MAALALFIFLALLAGCGWGCYLSLRLMFRAFNRIIAPAPENRPEMAAKAVSPSTRPGVPAWTGKFIADHIATCVECREGYVSGTLSLLEPETVTRIVALVEAHDAPRVTP